MAEFAGVYSAKRCTGASSMLPQHLATVVKLDRRSATRSEALVRAWRASWELPNIDTKNVTWVGVDPSSIDGLGTARVETLGQNRFKDLFSGVTAGSVRDVEHADSMQLSAYIVEESNDAGLPVPMIASSRMPFGESGLSDYPITRQGCIGKELPTMRVHTFSDLLNEPDVWPEQYGWLIPHFPVYRLTAFIPVPRNDASEACQFFPDYCFVVSASRGMLVHKIVEDRYAGASYNPPEGFSLGGFGMRLTDSIWEEGAEGASHSLFRAEKAPSIGERFGAGSSSVFGRFLFVVEQQPQKEYHSLHDSSGSNPVMMKASFPREIELSGTSVGLGRKLEPVKMGSGVNIDPQRLPTIFDVRVISVAEGSSMTVDELDALHSIVPFSRST